MKSLLRNGPLEGGILTQNKVGKSRVSNSSASTSLARLLDAKLYLQGLNFYVTKKFKLNCRIRGWSKTRRGGLEWRGSPGIGLQAGRSGGWKKGVNEIAAVGGTGAVNQRPK
jgi:hypothetical protein